MKFFGFTIWPISHIAGLVNFDPKGKKPNVDNLPVYVEGVGDFI